jgi:dTDP-L-rhamnose 4-epimerase
VTRVLVTGAGGFIGTHVTAALVAAGNDVVALDVGHPAAHHGPGPATVAGIPVLAADLRDAAAVARALRGVDAVVHLAAMVGMGVDLADLPEYVGCNDLGTAVLLAQLARAGVQRLVLASSMVVYGEGSYTCDQHGPVRPARRRSTDLAAGRFDPPCPECAAPLVPAPVDEDARLEPRSVYAATKLAQEHLAAAWAAGCDGSVVALRYHNVYGPGMPRDTPYSGVAAIFRSALAAGHRPRVFEDGGQRRDFVHVSDVAAANVSALAATAPETATGGFRAYNVASGTPTTIGGMAAALAAAADGPAPVVTGEFRPGDVRHVVASPARAAAELGFRARVDPATGLAEFVTAPLRAAH